MCVNYGNIVCHVNEVVILSHGQVAMKKDNESLQIIADNHLDALFPVFIYFISLRVSSITVPIIRRSNCINTSPGMVSLCGLLGMPVPPDRHTKQSLTQTNHTR
jgi:hypothetical protein